MKYLDNFDNITICRDIFEYHDISKKDFFRRYDISLFSTYRVTSSACLYTFEVTNLHSSSVTFFVL